MKQRKHDTKRRKFLQVAPMALVGTSVMPHSSNSSQVVGTSLTPKTIGCAELVAGLEFSESERKQILPSVENNVERYARLRQLELTYDVEPATVFHPYQASNRPTGAATPNAKLPVSSVDQVLVRPVIEELAFQPVTVLSNVIKRREVTPTDLTRMYLARLRRYRESINCVVTLTEELALKQAAAADRELAAGRYRGPLHGIPWGAKDLFATKSIRTTWGARPFENQVIDVDATVVERLRDAGAVLVAKLAVGALARGGVWFGGAVQNPWDLNQTVNASSAGPGAAAAGGLVAFSVASETRGSIISTSNPCGVTGLRSTYGRISRYGVMAASWTMDKIGPMCRSVEDCAHVFNAIYGSDGRDDAVVDAPFEWPPKRSLSQMRLGYVQQEFEDPPPSAPERERDLWPMWRPVWASALETLRSAGAVLQPIELPAFPHRLLQIIQSVESAALFDDLTRNRELDSLTENGSPGSFRSSSFIPAVDYVRAQRARKLLMREMDRLMTTYDAFVSPPRSEGLQFTSFTGHPALVLKAGFAQGVPVGVMFTERLFDETSVLQLGMAFEGSTRWHTMNPALG